MATLTTIPAQSGEVIRALLTLDDDAGTDLSNLRATQSYVTQTGDIDLNADVRLNGIDPFTPGSSQGDIRLRKSGDGFNSWRVLPGNDAVELRFSASFDGDTVRQGTERNFGGGFWNWFITGLPSTVQADGGATIALVMNVPTTDVFADATLTARAGNPTATVAAAAALPPFNDATLTALAGSPTVAIVASATGAPFHNAELAARAGNPTVAVTASSAAAPIRDATLSARAGSPTVQWGVVVDGLAIDASFMAEAGVPRATWIAATGRNPYDSPMSRGIPYVSLADAPAGSGLTLAHIIAASNLAADRTGWTGDYLIPTVKAWRIPSAKAGTWRYDMGMPVIEAVTPGLTIDGHILQFTAAQSGGLEVVAVMGFGWLEPQGRLTDSIGIDTAIIPGIAVAPGDSYLIGHEHVWYDADSALVRLTPFVHAAGDPIRRVHPNATLASAILRLAGRQKDYEERAGYSAREAQRPMPGAKVQDFRVMDTEAAQTLQPFIRPSMLIWKRPSNYGLLEVDPLATSVSTPTSMTQLVDDVLAAIREGDDIDIDRSVDEQITINADPGGGLEITSLYALLAGTSAEPTVDEFLASTHAFGPVITVPAFAGRSYLWFAADQPLNDLRETGSAFSAFPAFEAAVIYVIGGVTHYAYRTVTDLNPRLAAVSWTARASDVIPAAIEYRFGIKATADFVAADFTQESAIGQFVIPGAPDWPDGEGRYMGFAKPLASGPLIRISNTPGGANFIIAWQQQATNVQINGVEYGVWVSRGPQSPLTRGSTYEVE